MSRMKDLAIDLELELRSSGPFATYQGEANMTLRPYRLDLPGGQHAWIVDDADESMLDTRGTHYRTRAACAEAIRAQRVLWAIVDRFGNSSAGEGRCISVHRTERAARLELERWDRSVQRGHGAAAHTGWTVERVPGDTVQGDRARPIA